MEGDAIIPRDVSSMGYKTHFTACTLLATEGRSRMTQESATSRVVMATPLCDMSMQKEKKEKGKKISMDVFNSLPYRCPLV